MMGRATLSRVAATHRYESICHRCFLSIDCLFMIKPILLSTILVGVCATLGADHPPASVTPRQARAAFNRFLALEGRWIGRSTRGWEEKIGYTAIAGRSVVMENSFDAHPGEEMVSMFHLDGDRLLLTHYCVAKNQPRLLLTESDLDGNILTFTFLDATNLPSRDKGHMDKAVFRFLSDSAFTCQWTWYEKGKVSWMEEITNKKITRDSSH